MKIFALLLAILGLLLLTGCQNLTSPHWLHPGTAPEQQQRAVRFDPYPENEPGPMMTGVRPREYSQPIAEPARARWHLGTVTQ